MRSYETIVVMDPQLDDEPIGKQIEAFERIITSHKGDIVGTERWGRRKLGYEIDDRQQGYYTLFKYNAEPMLPIELDRLLKLNEHVLRHLTVRVKKHTEGSSLESEETTVEEAE